MTTKMESHYLFLSSSDGSKLFSDINTHGDFIVQLPKRLDLSGSWKCALTEFQYTSVFQSRETPKEILVCSDLCESSYCVDTQLPLLRRISIDYTRPNMQKCIIFTRAYYMPVKQGQLSQLKIYIKTPDHKNVTFKNKVSCVLHLKKE